MLPGQVEVPLDQIQFRIERFAKAVPGEIAFIEFLAMMVSHQILMHSWLLCWCYVDAHLFADTQI